MPCLQRCISTRRIDGCVLGPSYTEEPKETLSAKNGLQKHFQDNQGSLAMVPSIDGHLVSSYSRRELSVAISDHSDTVKTYWHDYYAVDMVQYDIILGFPWLEDADLNTFWANMNGTIVTVVRLAKRRSRTHTRNSTVQRYRPYKSPKLLDETFASPNGTVVTISAQEAADAVLKKEPAFLVHLPVDDGSDRMTFLGATGVEESNCRSILRSLHMLSEHTSHDHGIELEPGKILPHKSLYNLSAT